MLKNRFRCGLLMIIGAIMVLKYGYSEIRYLIAFFKMKVNLSYTNVTTSDLYLCALLTVIGIIMILFGKLKILEYEK